MSKIATKGCSVGNLLRLAYRLYAHNLERSLPKNNLPRHIGVILDGNRRWAKQMGAASAQGHKVGADKTLELLEWSREVGVEIVTLWMLSTDNLSRTEAELTPLFQIICHAVQQIADTKRWQLRLLGNLNLLPPWVKEKLEKAVASSASSKLSVNIAVGYGGREEITEAVRRLLVERSERGETIGQIINTLQVEDITAHMYTAGQPDPDLVIRTSGEQRLSGFLMWQSAHSEYYFCEAYWPDFRKIDFYRALRDYAQRERRLGR